MLKKLFYYDCKYMWKLWWILALCGLAVSVLCGGVLNLMFSNIPGGIEYDEAAAEAFMASDWENYEFPEDEELPGEDISPEEVAPMEILMFLGSYFGFLLLLGIVACVALFTILQFNFRYYRHLYSDEGQLTFMLPVRRRDLINEKLLFGIFWSLIATVELFVFLAVIFAVGCIGHTEGLRIVMTTIRLTGDYLEKTMSTGTKVLLLAAEILAPLIATVCSVVISYLCITIGAVVAKRKKLLAGIGFYAAIEGTAISAIYIGAMIITLKNFFNAGDTVTSQMIMNAMRRDWLVFFSAITAVWLVIGTVGYILLQKLNRKKLNLA